ncbi:hypothetical protein NMK43_08575 [Bacillus licheniformis]|uniref:hypothetical protein n=1 Tax=Bacillus licheniformis TaxID=1402 RepID=UPI0020C88F78|nr:hypothetical protein [Bacillus licheniformis]MCP8973149.1 hypothetical protein [Bacillus licheniformis]
MQPGDTVFYWSGFFLEEAQIIMVGGINQVLLKEDRGIWILKDVEELIRAEDMTDREWKYVNI